MFGFRLSDKSNYAERYANKCTEIRSVFMTLTGKTDGPATAYLWNLINPRIKFRQIGRKRGVISSVQPGAKIKMLIRVRSLEWEKIMSCKFVPGDFDCLSRQKWILMRSHQRPPCRSSARGAPNTSHAVPNLSEHKRHFINTSESPPPRRPYAAARSH